jgi:RNA polymerase sigma-70 factor (ECF subfamily)
MQKEEDHMVSPQPRAARSEPFGGEMTKHIPALRGLAKLLTRNEEAAADLTQDTLAKAWKARKSFAPGTNLRAWLFTIMRNHFRSEARRSWRQVAWEQEAAERIAAPDAEQLWAIELEDTVRAIATLSKAQRDALILAGVGGLSSEDAGTVIACRPTAIKSRVSRARHAVRAMLDGTAPLRRGRSKCVPAQELGRQLRVLTARAAGSTTRGSHAPAFA